MSDTLSGFTVRDLCQRWRIGGDKIRALIRAGKLTAITLVRDTEYKGFIPYPGTVVQGVTLTDSKKTVLEKLGSPTKVEDENLPQGTNPDVPVKFAQWSKYYWRFHDYAVQISFLNQAQRVGDAGAFWPRDSVILVVVSK